MNAWYHCCVMILLRAGRVTSVCLLTLSLAAFRGGTRSNPACCCGPGSCAMVCCTTPGAGNRGHGAASCSMSGCSTPEIFRIVSTAVARVLPADSGVLPLPSASEMRFTARNFVLPLSETSPPSPPPRLSV
jgi:hypothetical protein